MTAQKSQTMNKSKESQNASGLGLLNVDDSQFTDSLVAEVYGKDPEYNLTNDDDNQNAYGVINTLKQ